MRTVRIDWQLIAPELTTKVGRARRKFVRESKVRRVGSFQCGCVAQFRPLNTSTTLQANEGYRFGWLLVSGSESIRQRQPN